MQIGASRHHSDQTHTGDRQTVSMQADYGTPLTETATRLCVRAGRTPPADNILADCVHRSVLLVLVGISLVIALILLRVIFPIRFKAFSQHGLIGGSPG
jgi:hypothetical protein